MFLLMKKSIQSKLFEKLSKEKNRYKDYCGFKIKLIELLINRSNQQVGRKKGKIVSQMKILLIIYFFKIYIQSHRERFDIN